MTQSIGIPTQRPLSTIGLYRKTCFASLAGALSLVAVSGAAAAEDTPRLVQSNDMIEIRMSSLDADENLVEVSWKQKGRRTKNYLQTAAKLRHDEGVTFVNIFIEKGLLPDFKIACDATTETVCSATVSQDFQYGQDKEGTLRFLVYHDQSNCPFQHRFMTTATAARFGEAANEMATKAGAIGQSYVPMAKQAADAFNQVAGLAQSAFGDYLRNMDGGGTCG